MIGIIMGSTSDLPVMQQAIDVLDELGLAYEVDIVSAHRTPEKLMDYGQNAHKRALKRSLPAPVVPHTSQEWWLPLARFQ